MAATAALHEAEIEGLTADSRKVGRGFLFAAIPGTSEDGRAYMAQAVEKGAVVVLAPEGTAFADYGLPNQPKSTGGTEVQLVTDANPRRCFAHLAASFYPNQPATIAAVTGTNGKTSVAEFTRQIWNALGFKATSLGTLGLIPARPDAPKALTTPDPVDLHHCLDTLAREGVSHLAMEASSHGLNQFRLDGVRITVAAFTNLSRDHLDYHGDEAHYLAAKERLFSDLLLDSGTAVLNADVQVFEELKAICRKRGIKTLTYGRNKSDLKLCGQTLSAHGQTLDLEIFGKTESIDIALAGSFHAENVLAALGLVVAGGVDPKKALPCLAKLRGVPGRAEKVATTPAGGTVYVDFAHTPDALETVLTALRLHARGRLLVVVGCGGDRDKGKRPMMGEIAQRLADVAIITDDNPRSEDPATIRAEILSAAPDAREIGDRAEAIRIAMAQLQSGDLLVIAGKGHESGQIVGDRTLPFDDADVARSVAAGLRSSSSGGDT